MAFDLALIPLSPTVCFLGISWHIVAHLGLTRLECDANELRWVYLAMFCDNQCTSAVPLQTSVTQLACGMKSVLPQTKKHQDLCEVLRNVDGRNIRWMLFHLSRHFLRSWLYLFAKQDVVSASMKYGHYGDWCWLVPNAWPIWWTSMTSPWYCLLLERWTWSCGSVNS